MTKEQLLQMAQETMTFEQYARNHARLLDVKAEPMTLEKLSRQALDFVTGLASDPSKGTV